MPGPKERPVFRQLQQQEARDVKQVARALAGQAEAATRRFRAEKDGRDKLGYGGTLMVAWVWGSAGKVEALPLTSEGFLTMGLHPCLGVGCWSDAKVCASV